MMLEPMGSELDIGPCVLKNLLIHLAPVRHTTVHAAYVYVVEAIWGIDPVATGIVDLELKVWRNLSGLRGRKICANYLAVRIGVGEIASKSCKHSKRMIQAVKHR